MKKKITLLAVLLISMTFMFTFTSCGAGAKNEVVYVYCYGDYYDQDVVSDFEAKTGIQVIQDVYDTAEEMYPVIKNNTAKYDVVCTSDYMIEKMINENLLAKVDKDSIPHLGNIDPIYMRKSEAFDPGNLYSVPYMVGVSGIMYNTKSVGDVKIDSWDDLWNKKFKDDIVMPDSMRDALMISLLKDGYSLNTTNENEVSQAADDLIKQKPLVYKYANDSARDLLADGSASVGVVWNGEYAYTKELNKDIEFVVPEEGSEFFIDSWVIPKGAKNKTNAEKWIDYLSEAKVAKKNFDYLHYTTPNKAAYPLIAKKYRNNPAIFPSAATIAKCESLKALGADGDDLYTRYWKKVKAE